MRHVWRYWPVLAIGHWIFFMATTIVIGTAAPGLGRIHEGRFYLGSRLGECEVSVWVYALSLVHFVVAVMMLVILAFRQLLRMK